MHNCHTHNACIETALEAAVVICDDGGLRFTKLRRAVLELVWTSHGPIKAYDILDQLDSSIASVTPPTVYRALDFLLENGLVHKLSSLNAYVGCSHPHRHHECYFLICTGCGEAMECCNSGLVDAVALTGRQNNFKPKSITLEITGECGDCQGRH
ncbi:MAG: Fur family transcriptional regulator [Sneathiella sp.]|nr:MAG: Fur family transcriptional regulator [Sneathiella sp.]